MPARFQRSRKAGYQLPKDVVYVGRPTIWGNPYPPGLFVFAVPPNILSAAAISAAAENNVLTVEGSVAVYAAYIKLNKKYFPLEEIRGRDLSCWCACGEPCHADVLLTIANAPAELTTRLSVTAPDIIAAQQEADIYAHSPIHYAMLRSGYTNVTVSSHGIVYTDQGIYRLNAAGRKIQEAHMSGDIRPTDIDIIDTGYQ